MGKHVVTPEICDKVRELNEDGLKAVRIAHILNIGSATVHRIKRAGYDFTKYADSLKYTFKMQQEVCQEPIQPSLEDLEEIAIEPDPITVRLERICEDIERILDRQDTIRDLILLDRKEKQPAILSTRLFSRKKK